MNRVLESVPGYPLLAETGGGWTTHPTDPCVHTMGARLGDYVLPKVPALPTAHVLVTTGDRVADFSSCGKHVGKRFNWRRPRFQRHGNLTICTTVPGRDYAYHYASLVATASDLRDTRTQVTVELPTPDRSVSFMDALLPDLSGIDVVIVGYVEALFRSHEPIWSIDSGFGWSTIATKQHQVCLLGCEFSYWGDLAGAMVTVLASRGARWVIYVGKLGTLNAAIQPNCFSATGRTSLVTGRVVTWSSRLGRYAGLNPDVLIDQRHITVPSILEETRIWHMRHATHYDVVDPEIGHMAFAALTAGIEFDYLHIVSDNLAGRYLQGLYDERSIDVSVARSERLMQMEKILEQSIDR